jgi:hypothetical protein
MPYSVGKSSQCPASKPHAVLKGDGHPVPGGCHKTREDALKHQRALMSNVPDAANARPLGEILERGVLKRLHSEDPELAMRDL